MPILAEYGLVPDVFDTACYTSAELCDVRLQNLKEVLLSEGIVRNLRNGDWLNEFRGNTRAWHKRGQELLKKLVTQNRLRTHPACLAAPPTSDVEWCQEAVASHGDLPLQGIITTDATSSHFRTIDVVAPIHRLNSASWWSSRSPSVRLHRTLADYEKHAALILSCANSAMFIDPHLDPSHPRYHDAVRLICKMGGRSPRPLIEIHRVCYEGSGPDRRMIQQADWENRFRQAMTADVTAANLAVEVFIWDEFHDRYIISELVGVGMSNGLDTTAAKVQTTWHRLGRDVRDDVQKEFDPASRRHTLKHRFRIP